MKKILFRVERGEKDIFEPNKQILASGEYPQFLKEKKSNNSNHYKVELENRLREISPINRTDYLYLFGEIRDALIYSSTMFYGNANIYIAETDSSYIAHKGDMNVISFIYNSIGLDKNIKHRELIRNMCDIYWSEIGRTFSPCYEYLTRQATIKELICTKEDCLKFHNEYCSDSKAVSYYNIEQCSVYMNKLMYLTQHIAL